MLRSILSIAFAFLAAAAVHAAPPQEPGTVTIQLGKGQAPADVKITTRKTTTSKSILLTVNPDWPVKILEYVQMHGGAHVNESTIPTFAKGSTEFRVKATTIPFAPTGGGAFRTVCPEPARMAFDDSLVYPGQPGKSHLHPFYGNDGSDAFSTSDSLRTTGGSTCHGGIANRSSYWFAGLYNTPDAAVIKPDTLVVYYKGGCCSTARGFGWVGADNVWHEAYISDPVTHKPIPDAAGKPIPKFQGFEKLPVGLAMITGSPARTTPRLNSDPFDFRWSCITPAGTTTQTSAIPVDCVLPGSYVIAESFFPQCWDGKNTDSPDHKAHMSFFIVVPNYDIDGKKDPRGWSHQECPVTHPKVIVAISFNVHYLVTPTSLPKNWRLVSDMYEGPSGYSLHADYREGWGIDQDDPEPDPTKKRRISEVWQKNCVESMGDCHADLLGDGRTLY